MFLLTMNSQPLNHTPTTPKHDPITPNSTQTTAKPLANNSKPKMAVVTTSDMMIDTKAVTQNRMKERVSGEGRKEEEMVCTLLGDTKEGERDEEDTGWEEEAKMQQSMQ